MVLALLNDEQQMLREMMTSLAGSVRARNPHDLAEIDVGKGWRALADAGMLGLRSRDASGGPAGSGVDVMVVAEALGGALAPLPYLGSAVLAAELLALAGAPESWTAPAAAGEERYTVLLTPDLRDIATASGPAPPGGSGSAGASGSAGGSGSASGPGSAGGSISAIALDSAGARHGLALSAAGRLVRLPLDGAVRRPSADRTREIARLADVPGGEEVGEPLRPDDLDRWRALGLTVASADAVGVMRAALDGVVAYAKERVAYGVPVATFQAVQHLCAEALVDCEAAGACVSYAAWAVDELPPGEAMLAACTAKAYTASASLAVTETVMQVYGGIGHTWEHVAHLFTRRALLDGQVLGDAAGSLLRVADLRLEGR